LRSDPASEVTNYDFLEDGCVVTTVVLGGYSKRGKDDAPLSQEWNFIDKNVTVPWGECTFQGNCA